MSTTYINFTSITWKTSEIWGIENQENEKFLDDYRKWTNLFPVGLIFSDTIKETLSTGIGLILKEIFWKFRFLLSLPVTTGSDGWHAQPPNFRLLSEIYHPWKFQVSISCSFWEKRWTWKTGNRPYLAPGSEFSKNKKNVSSSCQCKFTL